jgi:hypothetical protein
MVHKFLTTILELNLKNFLGTVLEIDWDVWLTLPNKAIKETKGQVSRIKLGRRRSETSFALSLFCYAV